MVHYFQEGQPHAEEGKAIIQTPPTNSLISCLLQTLRGREFYSTTCLVISFNIRPKSLVLGRAAKFGKRERGRERKVTCILTTYVHIYKAEFNLFYDLFFFFFCQKLPIMRLFPYPKDSYL